MNIEYSRGSRGSCLKNLLQYFSFVISHSVKIIKVDDNFKKINQYSANSGLPVHLFETLLDFHVFKHNIGSHN